MTHPGTHARERAPMAHQSRLATLLEIALVLLPLYAAQLVANRSGSQHIVLSDQWVLLGHPITYLGLAVTMAILGAVTRRRGARFFDYGVARPTSWPKTILLSLIVSLAVFGVVVLLINPLLASWPNLAPRDMSRFGFLAGNLPSLLINLPLMWLTAGFLEEFLWRGYVMRRLVDMGWRNERVGWLVALFASVLIFGLAHAYQGPAGMLKTGLIGLVFGIAFLVSGRNLWPLVLAHALIDALDLVGHYLG